MDFRDDCHAPLSRRDAQTHHLSYRGWCRADPCGLPNTSCCVAVVFSFYQLPAVSYSVRFHFCCKVNTHFGKGICHSLPKICHYRTFFISAICHHRTSTPHNTLIYCILAVTYLHYLTDAPFEPQKCIFMIF